MSQKPLDPKRELFKTKNFGLILGILVFLVLALLYYLPLKPLFDNMETSLSKLFHSIKLSRMLFKTNETLEEGATLERRNLDIHPDIMLLGIDSRSLQRLGRFPFRRSVYSILFQKLARISDQTKRENAVFLDIFFIEPQVPAEEDSLLQAGILENGRVFLETVMQNAENPESIQDEYYNRLQTLFNQQPMPVNISGNWQQMIASYGLEPPLSPLGQFVRGFGHANFIEDFDQVYRRQPLIYKYSHQIGEVPLQELLPDMESHNDFIRYAYEHKQGYRASLPSPLTQSAIDGLRSQIDLVGVPRTDGDDGTQTYFIKKYQDYFVPSITLALALEYWGVGFDEIEVEIGNRIHIPNPTMFNPETGQREPYRIQRTFPEYEEVPLYTVGLTPSEIPVNKAGEILGVFADIFQINPDELGAFYQSQITTNTKIDLVPDVPQEFIDLLIEQEDVLEGFSWEVTGADFAITKPAEYETFTEVNIPINGQGQMLIHFAGPASDPDFGGEQTFPYRSFSAYATNLTSPNPSEWRDSLSLENKILMVGPFSKGMADDEKLTPYGLMYGVEIHTNALNTILQNSFILNIPEWIHFTLFFLAIFVSAFIASRLSPIWSLFGNINGIFIWFIVSYTAYMEFNLIIPFVPNAIGIVLIFLIVVAYRIIVEEKEKRSLQSSFGKFVNPVVVEQMLNSPPELGGVDKELTVFFSDIRGFTTLSEGLAPQELVTHLNEYLTVMTNIIMEYSGTLDKYVGDEIMCFWGAPLDQNLHAELACKCALRQMEALNKLNSEWPDHKQINIGIGLNSGIMTVGNMGSMGRMNYTLMGDNVNLGARLEGTNKAYGTNVIISEYTYSKVKEKAIVRELDNIRVKGKNKPVLIYELLDFVDGIDPPEIE